MRNDKESEIRICHISPGGSPTEHLVVLVSSPFFEVVQKMLFGSNLHYIWCTFSIIILKIYNETAPSKDSIWSEFSEQHQNQKKHHI